MKKTILALSLSVVLAACSGGAANNAAGPAGNIANSSAGLPERPADKAGQQSAGQQLMCVRNGLSADERRAVADAALEQAPREDPRAQALLRAVDACATQFSWSPQKRRLAGMFSMSAAGSVAVQDELEGQGISVAELDQAITGDQELMAAAAAGQLGGGTAGAAFAQRHAALIERMTAGRDQALAQRIGAYIFFQATVVATGRQFERES